MWHARIKALAAISNKKLGIVREVHHYLERKKTWHYAIGLIFIILKVS